MSVFHFNLYGGKIKLIALFNRMYNCFQYIDISQLCIDNKNKCQKKVGVPDLKKVLIGS